MLIQVNTDHNIHKTAGFKDYVETTLRAALARFSDQVTRVEVHLSDEKGGKEGGVEQMRCLLEARPTGLQPLTVCEQGGSQEQVLAGSVEKLVHLLESTFARLERA